MRDGAEALGPDAPRIFIAVPLPHAARTACEVLIEAVRAAEPPGRRGARWVRTDGLHLTIRFLGPTPPELVDEIGSLVREVASTIPPFAVELGTGGAFPNHDRPRAMWIGVRRGVDELAALAAVFSAPLAALGWQPDDRPYRAHLTIARTDAVPRPIGRELVDRLVEVARPAAIPFDGDRITLFRSITGGGAARYDPLVEARLTGPPPAWVMPVTEPAAMLDSIGPPGDPEPGQVQED